MDLKRGLRLVYYSALLRSSESKHSHISVMCFMALYRTRLHIFERVAIYLKRQERASQLQNFSRPIPLQIKRILME
jgi:hypothetical protein